MAATTQFLTRDQILNVDDATYEEVPVPEWGGKVLVKGLSGEEKEAYERSIVTIRDNGKRKVDMRNVRAKLVQRTVVDPITKQPMFTEADINGLGRKSAAALSRVYETASKLAALTEQDAEELAGNSETPPTDGSGSN